jgi:hypothetical protein
MKNAHIVTEASVRCSYVICYDMYLAMDDGRIVTADWIAKPGPCWSLDRGRQLGEERWDDGMVGWWDDGMMG